MKDSIQAAGKRIAPYVLQTPCRETAALGEVIGGKVFLKLENLQITGSFKLRGVVNKILSLSASDAGRLLVTASTGNHAAAFAHAVAEFGLRGMLFMPKTSSAVKIENMRSTGVPFELVGEDCVEVVRQQRSVSHAQVIGQAVWRIAIERDFELINKKSYYI